MNFHDWHSDIGDLSAFSVGANPLYNKKNNHLKALALLAHVTPRAARYP